MLARSVIFAMLVSATALFCLWSPSASTGNTCGVVMNLPDRLEGFTGVVGLPSAIEKQMLPDDTEFAKATYTTPTHDVAKRDVVHCSIVLSGAERRSIHRPEVCLVGQGWTLMGSKILSVDMGDGRSLPVKDLYIEKQITLKSGEQRLLRAHYLYWFVGADVTTPSHTVRIWLTLWDNLVRQVNHRWAYPSMMALVTEGFASSESGERVRTSEETVSVLVGLIQQLAPKFQKVFMEGPAQ